MPIRVRRKRRREDDWELSRLSIRDLLIFMVGFGSNCSFAPGRDKINTEFDLVDARTKNGVFHMDRLTDDERERLNLFATPTNNR